MIPVESNRRYGDRRDENARRLHRTDGLAQERTVPQREILCQDLHKRQRHRHGAKEPIGYRQVQDEQVPRRSHRRFSHHRDYLQNRKCDVIVGGLIY